MTLKGIDNELPVIVNELTRSAQSIIANARTIHENNLGKKKNEKNIAYYAYDFLLLIGNRKLCRHIVNSSPATAIIFFQAITKQEKYDIPAGSFSKNISTEAVTNKDSILYHEDQGYKCIRKFNHPLCKSPVLTHTLHQ